MSSTKQHYTFVTIYKRAKDACNEEWHKRVTSLMYDEFGAVRTLWNFAWIEYKMLEESVDECVQYFQDLGFKVTTEDE